LEGKWNNSYANLKTERKLTHLTSICYTAHFNDFYHLQLDIYYQLLNSWLHKVD